MISTNKNGNQRREGGAASWPEDPNNPAITSTQYINHQMSLVKTVQKSNRTQLPSRNHFDVSFKDGRLLFENEKVNSEPSTQRPAIQVRNPKKAKIGKKLKIFGKRRRKGKKQKSSPNDVNDRNSLIKSLGSSSTHILGSSSEDTDKSNTFGFTPMKTRESTKTYDEMTDLNFVNRAPRQPTWGHSDLHENVTTVSDLTMSSPLAAIQKQREHLLAVLGVSSSGEQMELNSDDVQEKNPVTTPTVTSKNSFFSCLHGGQQFSSYMSKGSGETDSENESSRYTSGSNSTDSGSINHEAISHAEIQFDMHAKLRSASSLTSYSSDGGNNMTEDELSYDESDVSTAVSSSMYPGVAGSRVVKYSSMAKRIISSVNNRFSDCLAPNFQSP